MKKHQFRADSNEKNIDEIKSIQFFDNYELNTNFLTKDKDGSLVGLVSATTIGIYNYADEKGNLIKEARLPEEVFKEESIKTLKLRPLTLGHPKEEITPENAKKYTVGLVGDGVVIDTEKLKVPIRILDKETIEKVSSGQFRSLSCGYLADLEKKSGNYLGQDYDMIQRNIRYNHVALVEKGRAGDLVEFGIRKDEIHQKIDNVEDEINLLEKNINNDFLETKKQYIKSVFLNINTDNLENEKINKLFELSEKLVKKTEIQEKLKKFNNDNNNIFSQKNNKFDDYEEDSKEKYTRHLKNLWKLSQEQAEKYRTNNVTPDILEILDGNDEKTQNRKIVKLLRKCGASLL